MKRYTVSDLFYLILYCHYNDRFIHIWDDCATHIVLENNVPMEVD